MPSFGEHRRIGIEGMAREEEADRLELVLQPLHRRPRLDRPEVELARPCRRGRASRPTARRTGRPCPAPRCSPVRLAKAMHLTRRCRARAHGCPPARSNAPAAASVSSARLLRALVLSRRGEIGEVLEGAVGRALGDQALHRLRADVLERGHRIADRAALLPVARRLGQEIDLGGVDAGRQDGDARLLRLGREHRELVGVAGIERHRGGEELLAEVRLEVGRVIADDRIGRRVALVEAVARELVDQLEDVLGVRLA